ncbi:sugar kinase [Mucilaginibacter sp.]|jgi:2-dehydro-3-deoxygluconokinase|uniref:sugar kinase n=1 Tax=Mucilaginibacter sp. TaxID=1882438 RepID=UPI002C73DFD9|nr:sugar kinase [Mucilaginibacter sp.]HTI60282.1 sugar kinase [Mucilaginibacter sp.]
MMNDPLKMNTKGKVLTFGELLLRISPDEEGQWLKDNQLPFFIAGAELNAATALALWDVPTKYVTALPDNGMAKQIVGFVEQQGIEMSVNYHGRRIGLYFLTKGKDLKNDALIYDRAYSAFSELKPGMIDWEKEFEGVSWFDFSAICPAISHNIADVCEEALRVASQKNITISVDLNYRSKLWKYGKEPNEVMPRLVQYCDLVMGNVWAAEAMLGIPVTPDIHESGQRSIYLKEALKTSEEIIKQYPKCKAVANTFRFDSEGEIDYYAALYTGGEFYNSNEYSASHIINKVGSGDCFMAGLIYGFYHNWDPGQTLEYATAAAFEKLFIESDVTNRSVHEILTRANEA